MTTFAVGDHMRWKSEAGWETGVITTKHTKDFGDRGMRLACSEEEPQFEITSE